MFSIKVHFLKLSVIAFLGVLFSITPSYAGEEIFDKGEVFIGGLQKPQSVAQGDIVDLCYRSSRYAFSGRRYENIYTVFMLTPILHIDHSVGKNGSNNPKDVILIKKVLRKLRYYHGLVNGKYDESLLQAIEKVQRELAGLSPDGRIDVDGKTITAIRIANADSLFVNETERLGSRRDHIDLRECVNFFAPRRVLNYDIFYCELSYIVDYKIGKTIIQDGSSINVLNANEERALKDHLYQYATRIEWVGSLKVASKETRPNIPFTVYLKVNDKALVLETKVAPGFSQDPLKFSWYIDPNYPREVQYKYRLAPHQNEWSVWSKQTETRYFFINPGAHVFEVGARYRDKSRNWKEVPKLSYDFDLSRAFVSKPVLKVISGPSEGANLESINIDDIYNDSKALLIGVGEFQDSKFNDLMYVHEDIRMMEKTLINLNFKVSTLTGKVKKIDILKNIEKLISSANEGDRIVIYFSTHGFTDRIVKSRGYIASYDCTLDDVDRNCIELDELEELLKNMIKKPVKHLLVILDSCSAGLGVIAKDINYQEIRITTKNGSHMLTAGMADQIAQMDHQLKMSTFTHYLVKGLNGEADIIEDNVISISELLLYVRYQVAKQTDGSQTPMMGRISGAGEMIFKLQ